MKICIFGAGAIGGFLGVKLAQAGADVTFIARGPHLAAMQANGVTLRSGGETTTVRPRCLADASAAGVQDYVVVTLKAHALPAAAPSIAAMLGPTGGWTAQAARARALAHVTTLERRDISLVSIT